jgi:hypothetical protein
MPTAYELWSMTSRNLLGCFGTEAEALAAVRDALERNGPDYAVALALGREDRRGRTRAIAHGSALIERALQKLSADGASPGGSPRSVASERST